MEARDAARGRRAFLPLLACLAALAAGCLGGGNSGSETTNGLTGVIRDGGNAPVAGARVLLLPESHNGAGPEGQRVPAEVRTNLSGTYAFGDIAPGTYNLEVADSATGGVAWVSGLKVTADGRRSFVDAILGKPASLSIRVPDFLGPKPGYLYLPGTTRFARVDSAMRAAGVVVIGKLAAGLYPRLELVVEENDKEPVTLAEDILVESGRLTELAPFASWAHTRRIAVNPVSAGAGSAAPVAGYPFLVRLASSGFAFAEAAGDGRDIRFTAADGKVLPYEIERWDSAAGLAEVWVRLDTVRWDTPGQNVTLHWGRSGAVAQSSGPSVFDGYASVWHLGEPGNSLPGGYKDATAHGNHATAAGINKTPHLEGAAGMCKSFAGELGVLAAAVPAGLGGDAGFTVTFWMKAAIAPLRSSILNFGAARTLSGIHFLIRPDTSAQFGAHDAMGTGPGPTAYWQNVFKMGTYLDRWTHVALVYDPAARKTVTWFDGRRMAESAMADSGMTIDAKGGLRMGTKLPGDTDAHYEGLLDEVRFHASILPESRIRLDFETQKP